MAKRELTKQERAFCELYVSGTAPYAGNAYKCYSEVFEDKGRLAKHKALLLLQEDVIAEYVKELEELESAETVCMKRYLTQNLKKILEETSTAEYRDRRGTVLSPAALRSVAVNAAKALMEMYDVREAQVNKLNIDANGEGGITFNVIVPNATPEKEE